MKRIISCDWGTSALRLRLINTGDATILADAISQQGILNTFELWKQSGKKENEKLSFYQNILRDQIKNLEEQLPGSLNDVPVIISGMASSNIGMMELPYKEIPFSVYAPDLHVKKIEATTVFSHSILLISGVKTTNDVMRGEETQLIGCINESKGQHLFIFPGTHSKHVAVSEGQVTGIKTYMTGEFFELLSAKSILSNSLTPDPGFSNTGKLKSFDKGVSDSQSINLLHSSFFVRTNDLLGKLSKEENYYYLSGLLIGSEIKEVINDKMPVTIVANELQTKLYTTALNKSGVTNVEHVSVTDAIVKGHCRMYSLHQQT